MSLVHDDLPAMDNADVRYGRPTLHKVHGEALAVLAGDALLVEAFRLLSSLEGVPADRVLRAVQRLCIAIGSNGLAGGQAVDVLARQGRLRATSLEELHAMKTGSLFEAAVAVGAELAGASDGMVRAVAEFGSQLGIAFQICDDLLDAEEVTNGRDAPGETNYAERVGPLRAAKLAEGLLLDALAALESQAGGNISGFAGIAMKLIERCRARSLSLSHRVRDDATRANDERYQTQL
jgi:geranylgeranyl diphosphate synthase type II